jgi:RNA polymerase sigma factor (sigma-70 family)
VNDRLKATTCDIEGLVRSSRAGDRGAFDELVRLYQRCAMKVAVRALGDAAEAAEAVQDGFVRAFLSIDKLRQPERFESWLLRIIVNSAINRRKAAKRKDLKIEHFDRCEHKKVFSPVQNQIGKELKEAIRFSMLKLSKKEVKAISLFSMEDLPYEKVAEIMGCSNQSARWHVFKARKKLKVLLKEYLK